MVRKCKNIIPGFQKYEIDSLDIKRGSQQIVPILTNNK